MALHPAYDCNTAIASVTTIQSLVQSPETHVYIARNMVVENVLEACEQKQKIVNDQQSSQSWQRKQEDPMVVKALKYVVIPPQRFCCTLILWKSPFLSSLFHTYTHLTHTHGIHTTHTHTSYSIYHKATRVRKLCVSIKMGLSKKFNFYAFLRLMYKFM